MKARLRVVRSKDSDAAAAHRLALLPGAALLNSREPDNPADPNAVELLCPGCSTHIGYVDRESAAVVAPWMDNGWSCTSTVKELRRTLNDSFFTVYIYVLLEPLRRIGLSKTTKKKKELEDV